MKCLSNINSQYELKSLDFESDYVALYTDAREAMAALHDEENVGPQKLAEIGDEADPNKYKALITDQRKNMKIGYERVKQKARDIGQEYRTAVTQGTRSGSSRDVCEKWEQLKILWGGSAAAAWLTNCRAIISHAEKQSDFNYHDEMNECNEGMHDNGEGVTQNRDGRAEDILKSASDNSPSVLNSVEQQRVSNQNCKRKNAGGTVQAFVDNKRKQLEKNISAAQ